MKKFLILFLLFALFIVIVPGSDYKVIFYEQPVATGQWIIRNKYNNKIGDSIWVTLRIVYEPGVTLDLDRLPGAGEVWELPFTSSLVSAMDSYFGRERGQGYSIGETRNLEVRSREIVNRYENGKWVTDIIFEFQYLSPLKSDVAFEPKYLSGSLQVYQRFLYFHPNFKRMVKYVGLIDIEETTFYLSHRIDENSIPMLKPHKITLPEDRGKYLVYGGYVFLCLGLLAGFVLLYKMMIPVRNADGNEAMEVPPPTMKEYYEKWLRGKDYKVFIAACLQYRRTRDTNKVLRRKTAAVLYSGIIFDPDRIKEIFEEMIKEEQDDTAI